jgi:tetratricopeptide (TPR) repeat protein
MTQMSPVEAIFFAALEKTTSQERAAYLVYACGDDANLRDRVERLLAAHPQVGNFLEQPAVELADTVSASPQDAIRSGPPLPANGSVLKVLTGSMGGVPHVHLREPGGEIDTPVNFPKSSAMPLSDPTGRLQLLGEIARGGMGAILKGRDVDLGRDIAVKVLLETRQGKTELARRFIEEAQIAGQLQHPGVTPVYELGVLPDKRPYFTMKLVKGQTLAALLSARKDASDDLSKYLGIFGQVCQTLAYAHARAVIHRDLKPSNIMVASFGEVQVMDWGLAKVLQQGGIADEKKMQQRQEVSIIRTQRSAGSASSEVGTDTQAGSVLGTPAYMAPEQARGDVDLVDERVDVFGLGAILCEILTGQPPFTGKGAEAQRKAQTAQLTDSHARLDACGADPELVELAKHCLLAEPWDRPRSAGAVAESVTAYQNSVAERLRQAELERAAAVARSEEARATARAEKRARRWMASLSAAVVVLAGICGWWLYQRASATRAVEASLAEVADAQQRRDWPAARLAVDRAEAQLAGWGSAGARQRVERIREDLSALAGLEETRWNELAGGGMRRDFALEDAHYAEQFRALGVDAVTQGPDEMADRIRSRTIPSELAAMLDSWAWVRQHAEAEGTSWRALVEAARLADDDDTRTRLRTMLLEKDWPGLKRLAAEMDPAVQPPLTLAVVGEYLRETNDPAATLEFLRKARWHHADDYWLNSMLGAALSPSMNEADYRESIIYFSAALALRPRSVGTTHSLAFAYVFSGRYDEGIGMAERMLSLDSDPLVRAHAHDLLGMAWKYKGDLNRSLDEHREAVRLAPDQAAFHHNLAVVLVARGELNEALAACREAVRLLPPNKQLGGATYDLIGSILTDLGKLDDAVASYRQSLRVDRTSVGRAFCLSNFGRTLRKKQDFEGALDAFSEAIPLDPLGAPANHCELGDTLHGLQRFDEAVSEYRTAIRLNPGMVHAFNSLGVTLMDKGDLREAEVAFRTAILIQTARRQKVVYDDEPKRTHSRYNLGLLLNKTNRSREAIEAFREAIKQDPKLAAAHIDLGNALRNEGELDQALRSYDDAVKVDPAMEARSLIGISNVLYQRGDLEESLKAIRRSIKLEPQVPLAHDNLGLALLKKGLVDEAIAAHRKALELRPDPDVQRNLAAALLRKGELDEALTYIDKSVTGSPNDARAHFFRGLTLRRQGKLDEAGTAFRRAIRLAPFFPNPHLDLGFTLQQQGRFTESLAAFQTGHELGSAMPNWSEPSADWLRQAEKNLERNALLAAVLKGEWKPADAEERIGFAQVAKLKRLFAGAVQLYEQAFAEQPDLAELRKATHRYDAACYAARAGAGEGDGSGLAASKRAQLRRQSRDWLHAELAAYDQLMKNDKPENRSLVQQRLQHWQRDRDLTGVRDQDAVAKLPAEEQEACKKLWADVETVLKKIQEKPE